MKVNYYDNRNPANKILVNWAYKKLCNNCVDGTSVYAANNTLINMIEIKYIVLMQRSVDEIARLEWPFNHYSTSTGRGSS